MYTRIHRQPLFSYPVHPNCLNQDSQDKSLYFNIPWQKGTLPSMKRTPIPPTSNPENRGNPENPGSKKYTYTCIHVYTPKTPLLLSCAS